MPVTGLAFLDASQLLSVSMDKTVRTWRVGESNSLEPAPAGAVKRFSCEPDIDGGLLDLAVTGKLCAVARQPLPTGDSKFMLFDVDSDTNVQTVDCSSVHKDPVSSLSFSPKGTELATVSRDKLAVWSVESGSHSCTCSWQSKTPGDFPISEVVVWVRWTNFGLIAASVGDAGIFVSRFQANGNQLKRSARAKVPGTLFAISEDKKGVLLGIDDYVAEWDGGGSKFRALSGLKFPDLAVEAVAVSRDASTLVCNVRDKGDHEQGQHEPFLCVYDLDANRIIRRVPLPAAPISVTASEDGALAAVGCKNGQILVADRSDKVVLSPKSRAICNLGNTLSWSTTEDAFRVRFGDGTSVARAFSLNGMRYVDDFTPGQAPTSDLLWKESDQFVSSGDVKLPFSPLSSGERRRYHFLPVNRTSGLTWNENHLKLVSVSGNEFVYSSLDGYEGEIKGVSVSPDGRFIGAICSNDVVRIWATSAIKPGKLDANPPSISNALFSFCLVPPTGGAQEPGWLLWNDDSATYAASNADAERFLGVQINDKDEKRFATWVASASRSEYNRLDLLAKAYADPSRRVVNTGNPVADYGAVASMRSVRLLENESGNEILPDAQGEYVTSAERVKLVVAPANRALRCAVDQSEARSLTEDDSDVVTLVEGRNTVRLFTVKSSGSTAKKIPAIDARGNPIELRVVYKDDRKPKSLPPTYVLAIGISKYAGQVKPLAYADQDADRIAARYGAIVANPKDHVICLLNEKATKNDILEKGIKAIAEIVKKDPEGRRANVIIFVAAHGMLDVTGDKPKWSILPTDYDPGDKSTGYDYEKFISDLLDNIYCKNIILLADTCFSGGAERSINPQTDVRTQGSDPQGDAAIKQLPIAHASLFALVSSMPNQLSFEDQSFGAEDDQLAYGPNQQKADVARSERGSGLFTHSLLKAMKDPDDEATGLVLLGQFEASARFQLKEAAKATNHKQLAPEPYFGSGSWEAQNIPISSTIRRGTNLWQPAYYR
jgi:WD40 repeat protein